jgi:hypothetical protein
MTWYAASIIIGLKPERDNAPFMAYENVVLIQADSFDDAERVAIELGKAESGVDEGLEVDGIPATRQFLGVRKVITVSNPDHVDPDEEKPGHSSEITYSLFKADSWEQLQSLAAGDAVTVEYLE